MRVSKETTTKVADGETLIGEVIESGNAAIVHVYGAATRNKSPLVIDAKDWQAFSAAVRALDRYVPNGTVAPTVTKKRLGRPATKVATPVAIEEPNDIFNLLLKRKRTFTHVILGNGARVRVGMHGLRALIRLAMAPAKWHAPKDLMMGQYGAEACWILSGVGLVERSLPRHAGRGKRAQYRINEKGTEALRLVRAMSDER